MGLGESIRLALEGLKANKMRAVLTMLGIIIGIAAVIGILTVGDGLSGYINGTMSDLGASTIIVSLQEKSREVSSDDMMSMMAMKQPEASDLITPEMVSAMEENFGAAPRGDRTFPVRRKRQGQGRTAVCQRFGLGRKRGVFYGQRCEALGRTAFTAEGR
ncbi:MAG: ABC transporter permease [Oscillospiraceae bacterium]